MTLDGTYKLTITPHYVRLYTFLYKAEKGSILHSALMNREATSLIIASAITGIFFTIYTTRLSLRLYEALAFCLLFGLVFLFLRLRIFREKPLEVTFYRDLLTIRYPSFLIKRLENFTLNQVKSISLRKRVLTIENPEGAEIVKKIALQHGTVIPDFTEPVELYLIQLELRDGRVRSIYADRSLERAQNLIKELKRWFYQTHIEDKIIDAQTD